MLVKLVILGISFVTSFILALTVVLVAKLVISGILTSIFLILASYKSVLTTWGFTTSLNLLKLTEAGTNLSISNLSTLDFNLVKSVFLAKSELSASVAFFNLLLLHN